MAQQVRYGLYHVNKKTKEAVPFSDPDAHNLSQHEAEVRTHDLLSGIGRGTAYPSDWTTEARPE